jgi:hypothetical protein
LKLEKFVKQRGYVPKDLVHAEKINRETCVKIAIQDGFFIDQLMQKKRYLKLSI